MSKHELARGDLIEATVDDVDDKARSWGRTPDDVHVRLSGALPGERVEARVAHVGRDGLLYADLSKVLEPAAERIAPDCPNFAVCGGCDFLHASMTFQHRYKRERVARALAREVEPLVESPMSFGYRAFAKLVVGPGRILGSYRPRSHEVVDMTGCRVHAPIVERVADRVRALFADAPADDLRYVLIRGTVQSIAEQRCVVTLVARTADSAAARAIADGLIGDPDVARVVLHVNDTGGNVILSKGPDIVLADGEAPIERIGPVEQSIAPGAFSQVNPAAAERLYEVVREQGRVEDLKVLDLYSGSGGMGLTLAAAGADVVGYELNPDAVRAANASAERMNLAARARFCAESVEAALSGAPSVDLIVVNPPRKGLSPTAISGIVERAPARLIYVSCNPDSLARDLQSLESQTTLTIERVTPVDMFPQTRHVETVVSMRFEPKSTG